MLKKYKFNKYSQLGEDGIIQEVFNRILCTNKYCVEFGAGDGQTNSNTANLIDKGWISLQIEADEKKYEKLLERSLRYPHVICLNRIVGFNDDNKLDVILKAHDFPIELDFLSIDIDGNDWMVWSKIEVYHPRVVLVEFNPTFPVHIAYVQPALPELNFGNSLRAFVQLANVKEYSLAAATEWNALFVNNEDFRMLGVENNSPEALWNYPHFLTNIVQGYNGELLPIGNNKLLWSNASIDMNEYKKQIQVLNYTELGYGGALHA